MYRSLHLSLLLIGIPSLWICKGVQAQERCLFICWKSRLCFTMAFFATPTLLEMHMGLTKMVYNCGTLDVECQVAGKGTLTYQILALSNEGVIQVELT